MQSFNGESKQGYNLLKWETSDAINFSHFKIEKSIDGLSFTRIGKINNDRTNGINTYNYSEENLNSNRTYYRLKLKDSDDKFHFPK